MYLLYMFDFINVLNILGNIGHMLDVYLSNSHNNIYEHSVCVFSCRIKKQESENLTTHEPKPCILFLVGFGHTLDWNIILFYLFLVFWKGGGHRVTQ